MQQYRTEPVNRITCLITRSITRPGPVLCARIRSGDGRMAGRYPAFIGSFKAKERFSIR